MTITLTPEQEEWLRDRVARGEFASVEDGVRKLIAERIVEERDDLAWARPYVDAAFADIRRGDVLMLEEHKARNASRLANRKD